MPVVLDSMSTGKFFHEGLGHLSESDFQVRGIPIDAPLYGKPISNVSLDVSDVGIIEKGAWVPCDDEGIVKEETTLVERGILKGRLHTIETAIMMGESPTGNGRSSCYKYPILVRQTNTVVKEGDYTLEELLKEIKNGLFIEKGYAGHYDYTGSFSVRALYGREIIKGEITNNYVVNLQVLGCVKSFKKIVGLTRNANTYLNLFHGCGKMKQSVIVGHRAPEMGLLETCVKPAPPPDIFRINKL